MNPRDFRFAIMLMLSSSWSIVTLNSPCICICICISLTYCFQFVNLPILAAWLMFHFATRTEHLYAALCLAGLGGGLMEAPVSDPWSKYLHKIEMRPTIVACPYDDLAEMVVYSMYWTQPFNWFNRFWAYFTYLILQEKCSCFYLEISFPF